MPCAHDTNFFLTDSNQLIAVEKTIGSLYIYNWNPSADYFISNHLIFPFCEHDFSVIFPGIIQGRSNLAIMLLLHLQSLDIIVCQFLSFEIIITGVPEIAEFPTNNEITKF